MTLRTTKRIIIRIIVAVAVAVILSKLKLLNIIEVNAKYTTDQFTYSNVLIDSSSKTLNFSNNFAKNFSYGTLKTNVAITTNIVTSATPTVLRQATVLNGGINEVCKIGSLQSGNLFTLPTSGTFNGYNLSSQTYSIECNLQPNSTITSMTLYFSGSLNQSYLSFGPYVTFKEDDVLLEIKKQNETCFPSKNLLPQNINTQTINGMSITRNSDGSLTFNGTSSNEILLRTNFNLTLEKGTYTHSIGNTVPNGVYLSLNNNVNTMIGNQGYSQQRTFTLNENTNYTFYLIYINPNLTLNNFTIYPMIEKGSSASSYEQYGKENCKNKQDLALDEQKEQTKQQKETNDLIKSDDTTDADSKGSDFFNNFDNNSHGLSGVITAPLSFIQSLTSKSCSPLHLEIGLVDKEFDLPCATTLMQQNFPSVLVFYQTITFGIISYLILIKIFGIVKDAKNPDSDKIEVLDL